MDRGKRRDALTGRFLLLAPFLAFFLQGCIFSYPPAWCEDSEAGGDEVSLTLLIHPPGDWADSVCTPSRASSRHLRMIVYVASPGRRTLQYQLSYPESILSRDTIPLKIPDPVKAGEVKVCVWCDPESENPLAYDVSSPHSVLPLISYGEETDTRMALTGLVEADLTDSPDSATISLPLVSPLGRYRIIASDYPQFLKDTAAERASGVTYTTTLRYVSDIPGAFDITTGETMEPLESVTFSKELPAIEIPGIEIAPVSDWLFVPAEGMDAAVEVSVKDSNGRERSRTTLSFPLRRGVITTLRAPILTTPPPGIRIDSVWNVEETIYLDL